MDDGTPKWWNEQPHDPTHECYGFHCWIHNVDEGDGFKSCGECFHAFPSAETLMADCNAVLTELNERYPGEPLTLVTDPDQVWACPHCAHDF